MQNFFFVTQNLLSREISRYAALLFVAASLAALSGCGSGQAIPSEFPVAASTTGPATASIQLLASSPQLDSSGVNTVDLTAVVLTSTKQTISGKTVTFSTGSDASAFINNISTGGVTDSNGVVTAKLNLGTSKANRTITLSASADSATTSASVDVTGTTVTVSGTSSLAFLATTTLIFSVKDSAGTALPGVTVSVTSATGNTIVLTSSGITNSAGQVSAAITASAVGDDTITATAAGASTTQVLTVSADSFTFTPLANSDINLGATQAITINWTKNGAVQAGQTVTFSASRGTIAGSPAITDATGKTTGVTITSVNTAGPAIITAAGGTGTPAATLDVVFVATSASSVTAQAVPGTISYTTGSASQTNNSSTISVIVRDASNNLVKNASVNFTITSDPSGGRLTSSSVTTDVSGSASVTYVAGATSSPSNGVVIAATVSAVNGVAIIPAISTTTSLTVAGQANLVSLGTDNLVGGLAPVNTKTYIATVTDTGGNRVAGATVIFSLQPARFRKGTYVADTVNNVWVQNIKATCANEDASPPAFDGIIQAGEDLNGNGKLDPGGVATVNTSALTDAAGNATATITYPKDHSHWAEVTLVARTGVAGNDPPTTVSFFVPGLAADYTDLAVSPPGPTSPYGAGVSTLCTNTL